MKRPWTVLSALLLFVAFGAWAAPEIPDGVRALAQDRCAGCHKGKFPPKGLNLEPANLAAIIDAPSRQIPEAKIVDPKAPQTSYLLRKVRGESGIAGRPMPPGKALTAEEIQLLASWIEGLK